MLTNHASPAPQPRAAVSPEAARSAVSGAFARVVWGRLVCSVADLLMVWQERTRQRRALQTLTDDLLKDVGLSRGDVMRETVKPFWRI